MLLRPTIVSPLRRIVGVALTPAATRCGGLGADARLCVPGRQARLPLRHVQSGLAGDAGKAGGGEGTLVLTDWLAKAQSWKGQYAFWSAAQRAPAAASTDSS